MKKRIFFTCIILLLFSVAVQAQQGYAVLSPDKTTLTFQYGTPPSSGTYYDTDNTGYTPGWSKDRYTVTTVVFDQSFSRARPISCHRWFEYFMDLTTIRGIENLITSEVIDMGSMFSNCTSLTSLDVSHFITDKVVQMDWMFSQCTDLTLITGLEKWNTSSVIRMDHMFDECHALTSIDPLKNWDVSGVTEMTALFYNCTSLTSVDLSNWNTSSVTEIEDLFSGCTALTSVTFGKNFSMNNVQSFNNVFSGCNNLRYIDFYKSDDTDAIAWFHRSFGMFSGIPATTIVYLPHGCQDVTDAQNVVYSYNGNEADLRCPEYYSEDKVDIEFPRDFKTNKAIYQRTMANKYGSVILPYDFTTNDNIQAYTLDEEHDSIMYFKNTDTVPAHTPFAFKKLGETADFTMTATDFGITVKATHTTHPNETGWDGLAGTPYTAGTNLNGWTAKGYYVNQTIEKTDPLYSNLHYIANQKFYKASGATLTFPPHRVTFHGTWVKNNTNSGTKAFVFAASDNEVIAAIKDAETRRTLRDAEAIYNLAGRRQHEVQKGVNIVRMGDGSVKKVFIK